MMQIVLLILGIFVLIKGADWLVDGSSALAKKWGIPSLIIGLTIVAFGTSAPELIVSLIAVIGGNTGTAFGNVIGSNLANLLLILGITALVAAPKIKSSTVWKEIPFSLLAIVVLFVVSNDLVIDKIRIFSLTRADGLILLLFFIIFVYYIIDVARGSRAEVGESLDIERMSNRKISLLIIFGVIGLFIGGKWVVDGAVFIAKSFGVSDFLIGATVIAIGTSLPELVTSVRAAMKKDLDMVVGNIVGSNIFNIFWILGIVAVVAPIRVPAGINFDIAFLGLSTVLFFAFMFLGKKRYLERYQAVIFIAMYIMYIAIIIFRG
jgi:cation:H+ antiporter